MKLLLFVTIIVLISSCSPPTKQEALDYYLTIRYEKCSSIMNRLDQQYTGVVNQLNDPRKLTNGASFEDYSALISKQKKLIPDLRKCVESLEKISTLGDNAEYLESLKIYFYYRLQFEDEIIMRIIESLEGGMSTNEVTWLESKSSQLFEMKKQQDKLNDSEVDFLNEFHITRNDIDQGLKKRGL